MQRTHRVRQLPFGVVLAFALALAACGGDGSPGPAESNTPIATYGVASASPTRTSATPVVAASKYTVQSGDTLSQIAEATGTTVADLRRANPDVTGDLIRIGQVLNVPGVMTSPASSNGPPSSGSPPSGSPSPPIINLVGNINLVAVVDKQHALPDDYVPPDLTAIPGEWDAPGYGGEQLRSEAEAALVQMLQAATTAGYDIRVSSSYRSYATQQATFQYWISALGEEQARRVSAEPGHSEHQLGTAVDLTSSTVGYELVDSFGNSADGQWLAANSYQFGFALSYPSGKEDVTGYAYEPWHFRYIGPSAAQAWHDSGLTLVEYLRGL